MHLITADTRGRRQTVARWLAVKRDISWLSQTVRKCLHIWKSVKRDPQWTQCKPAHRPWWLPPSRTCPACWCGWWCWCWAGRLKWGGWQWRRVTAAGSAGSTSRQATWPGSRGWSCWAPLRSCGRGWSLEEERGGGVFLSVHTCGNVNWSCSSYGNAGVLCSDENPLGLLSLLCLSLSSVCVLLCAVGTYRWKMSKCCVTPTVFPLYIWH